MDTVTLCPLCNTTLEPYLNTQDFFNTGEAFRIDQCNSCKLLITNPQPDKTELGKYYDSDQYLSHHTERNDPISLLYKWARYYSINNKIKLINRYSSGQSILDYGCGTGDFLLACQKKGWDIRGMEPDQHARSIAENKTGIQLFTSIHDVTGSFDIITLWHVLEHLPDFLHVLDVLKKSLTPKGIILLALPNYHSPDAHYYDTYWAGYDVPRHLYHFSKSTINRLADKAGFQLEAIHPMKLDSFYVSLLSEGYKHPGHFPYLRAIKRGWLSNRKAAHDTNYSSLIYILRHNA